MRYSEELIEEVRSKNDIVQVVSQFVKISKKGSNYFGCCPFHNEKTPSFSVSPSKQMYYCFGCGAGGNVLTFVMEYENETFPEAMKELADRAGISLPEGEVSEEEKREQSLKSTLFEMNRAAATYFFYQLKTSQGQRAHEYFTKRRLSEETIKKFGLGYAQMYRDDLYQYLKKKGYSDRLMDQSGLVKITEKDIHDRFWNRAIFPIMDANSKVIGFGGRVMGDGEPKYLNSPETPIFDKSRNLYGLHLARRSRRPYFLVCEGYMDVISMHQAGFDCAVASLGTALTTGHAMLIKRYVKEVILCYDSDGAGIKAAMRAIPMLKDVGIRIRVLNLKPWKDPDEFIVHEGKEAFEERIKEAIGAFLFESDVISGRYDMSDPEQKTEFHREIAKMLLDFPDELERDNYMDAVCKRHGIPKEALASMVRRMSAMGVKSHDDEKRGNRGAEGDDSENRAEPSPSGSARPRQVRDRLAREKDEGLIEAERLILNWSCSEGARWDRLVTYLTVDDFSDPVCRELAGILWDSWASGTCPEPAALLNHFLGEDRERSRAAAVFNTVIPPGTDQRDVGRILAESVKRIKRASLDRAARGERDARKLQDIIMEKVKLEHSPVNLL